MKIFGIQITKAVTQPVSDNRGGWWPIIREAATGNWQKNIEVSFDTVLANHAVFSCMTRIARDVAKLRVKLIAKDSDGIWTEISDKRHTPVLRKPNAFQTRNQFWECWMLSKLSRGNTYALKERNGNMVTALYVLDPSKVTPLVTPDGAVYYELRTDNMAGLEEDKIVVPASEIIHDRFNCLFHPLVGLSPIYANGLAATQGLAIQNNSTNFFHNASRPGGMLIAPGRIDPDDAARLKEAWEAGYGGNNSGKVAVLGDGMKYEAMATTAVDAQLIEQLKWTAEVICSTFHVPPYKVGVGSLPSVNNIQSLNVEYYSQCIQSHLEDIESVLNEGLGTGWEVGTEFDTDNLLRMDALTQMDVLEKSKSVLTLDERRKKLSAKPVTGGDTIYLQQQDHSIEAIAARDALLIEQANNPPVQLPVPANDEPTNEQREMAKALLRQRVRERVDA